jgi:hypothetical protein
LDPSLAVPYNGLGAANILKSDWDEAIGEFNKAK